MQIVLFEDEKHINFEPLIYYRPVYELVCGANTLREKIERAYPGLKVVLHCRKYLEELLKSQNPSIEVNNFSDDEVLFINGRVVAPENLSEIISSTLTEDKVFKSNGTVVSARVSGDRLTKILNKDILTSEDFDGIPSEEVELTCAEYLWDLVYLNGEELKKDIASLSSKNNVEGTNLEEVNYPGVNFIKPEKVFISENVEIKPGVVLDASKDPIYLDKDVVIYPNAVIEGPVYIGESSKVKSCATIYENVSVGKFCKVGGEVEDSIIMSYSNKQHSGFLGHSYLGRWVNIGADTNCSDLQNNYGTIKVQVNGRHIDTGRQFVGLMMGDHSKTAINTMFNTGTVVGFSCNVYGEGFPPKYISSFGWGGSSSVREYKLAKAIETAKEVYKRRNKVFGEEEKNIFNTIFNLTKADRERREY
jgi:UDP-N-acetylglucosamine diphosphorylase/glucosamine-1-phosphate N-acetyltransferase